MLSEPIARGHNVLVVHHYVWVRMWIRSHAAIVDSSGRACAWRGGCCIWMRTLCVIIPLHISSPRLYHPHYTTNFIVICHEARRRSPPLLRVPRRGRPPAPMEQSLSKRPRPPSEAEQVRATPVAPHGPWLRPHHAQQPWVGSPHGEQLSADPAKHEQAHRATPPMGMPYGSMAEAPPALATGSAARDQAALMGTNT